MSSVNTAAALTSMSSQVKIADSNISAPAATFAPPATPLVIATTTLMQQPILATQVLYPAVSACDNSIYVSDVTIPDRTVFAPGATFTKTWRMQNTGTCAWNAGYAMTFSSGDGMSGATTIIDKTVAPSAAANISVELTAPSIEGTYTGYWILANSSGTAFGNIVYVQIVVSAAAETDTPAPTPTPTTVTSATIEPTAAPIPTFTPIPIAEPTIEPTAIPTEEPVATTEP
jgi:hypothetical protein